MRLALHIGRSRLVVVRTAGTRVSVPISHCTELARTLEKGKREIREEGSSSLIDQVYGTRREAARRPPLLAHSRYTISPLVSTHVRVLYTLLLYARCVLSQHVSQVFHFAFRG